MNPRVVITEHYVVYHNPKDYPGKWVVRKWLVCQGEKEPLPDHIPVVVADSKTTALGKIPMGMHCIPRFPDDDPCVVEVWL